MTCLNNCPDDNMSQTPDVWADDVFLPKKEECLTFWVCFSGFGCLMISTRRAKPILLTGIRPDGISSVHIRSATSADVEEQHKLFLPLWIGGWGERMQKFSDRYGVKSKHYREKVMPSRATPPQVNSDLRNHNILKQANSSAHLWRMRLHSQKPHIKDTRWQTESGSKPGTIFSEWSE